MTQDFTKEFFVRSWPGGYYEHFSYGVGIDKVCQMCIDPFVFGADVLEIGSGGGTFTHYLYNKAKHLTCIDVIPQPEKVVCHKYIELDNQDYNCTFVPSNTIDFVFSYNTFCHFSNEAIRAYLESVNEVLRPAGSFVFMLSRYGKGMPVVGDLLPMGHFAQDERTLPLVIGEGWEVVSPDMIGEHRDIIIHLKKIWINPVRYTFQGTQG